MGISLRKMLLLGVTGVGGVALVADRTFLTDAVGATGMLTDLAGQVQSAQSIVQTLDSGDPAAIQTLLDSLVNEKGANPSRVQAGLFNFGSVLPGQGDESENDAPAPPPPGGRVSMIITTSTGGLAVINGKPMRVGQTVDGLSLVAVHQDCVEVEDAEGLRTLRLR